MNIMSSSGNSDIIHLNAAVFFGLNSVSRVRHHLEFTLNDHAYRPKDDDFRSDWVASVAAPAFNILASEGIYADSFCTIGTGVGLDALAAVEILRASIIY